MLVFVGLAKARPTLCFFLLALLRHGQLYDSLGLAWLDRV
jgi:hypothetical protein